jgi:hypothetical protein
MPAMRRQIVTAIAACALAACSPPTLQPPAPSADTVSKPATSAAASSVSHPSEPYSGYRYTFRVDEGLKRLDAKLCFEGVKPSSLSCPMPTAAQLLVGATAGERTLTRKGDEAPIAGVRAGECVSYQVDLDQAAARDNTHQGAARIGRDALLSPDLWLWTPEPRPADTEIRARFELPPQLRVAVPWPRTGDAAFPFVVPNSAFVWRSQGAFGRFRSRALDVGGSRIEVAVLGDEIEAKAEARIMAWLRRSASAVAGQLGRFPVLRAQLLLVPRGAGAGSFGLAMRGGGASAMLLIANDATAAALAEDWTAVHELMHFSLPPMESEGAWLYEGMATYLTATARARAGMISERAAWWELLDGFERGEGVGTGVSLREESTNMRVNRSYWRVYWSGAAMALAMDVELRKQGSSLPSVVAKLAQSELDLSHRWTAEEVVARLDKLSASDVPSRVTRAHIDATAFPDTSALRRTLGVRIAPDKSAVFDRNAPDAAVRRAIMRSN